MLELEILPLLGHARRYRWVLAAAQPGGRQTVVRPGLAVLAAGMTGVSASTVVAII